MLEKSVYGVIWVTGLPGAGKTTFSKELIQQLKLKHINCILLDGDEMRYVFNNNAYDLDSRRDLAFQYARLCKMLSDQKQLIVCSTVSMFEAVRFWNRENISPYMEVFLDVSIAELAARDQKQLYTQSDIHAAVVPGINQEVERPTSPDYHFKDMHYSALNEHIQLVVDQVICNHETCSEGV